VATAAGAGAGALVDLGRNDHTLSRTATPRSSVTILYLSGQCPSSPLGDYRPNGCSGDPDHTHRGDQREQAAALCCSSAVPIGSPGYRRGGVLRGRAANGSSFPSASRRAASPLPVPDAPADEDGAASAVLDGFGDLVLALAGVPRRRPVVTIPPPVRPRVGDRWPPAWRVTATVIWCVYPGRASSPEHLHDDAAGPVEKVTGTISPLFRCCGCRRPQRGPRRACWRS